MGNSLRALTVVWLAIGALCTCADAANVGTGTLGGPTPDAPAPTTSLAAAAQPSDPAAAAVPEEGLSEVVIEAPEPVYVAPTLRDRIGRIWAPVRIDGKGPFRLVLDTGASHSAITSRVANRLDDASVQTVSVLLHGVTGSAIVSALKVRSMEVGDMLIEPTTLPIVADAFGGAEGVLGREGLMDKRIFADFGGDKLTIGRSHGQHAAHGYKVVRLTLTPAGLLAADVRIGGVKTRAIIDTGAQQTVGNNALMDALMRRVPRDALDEQIIGVTLDQQMSKYIRVPPITLGDLKLNNVHVAFGDMALFQHWKYDRDPTLLIGMDVLGLFDKLIIDYKMREMQIQLHSKGEGIQLSVDPYGNGLMHGS